MLNSFFGLVSVLFLLTKLFEEFHTVGKKAGLKVTADLLILLKLCTDLFSNESIITHSVWHKQSLVLDSKV